MKIIEIMKKLRTQLNVRGKVLLTGIAFLILTIICCVFIVVATNGTKYTKDKKVDALDASKKSTLTTTSTPTPTPTAIPTPSPTPTLSPSETITPTSTESEKNPPVPKPNKDENKAKNIEPSVSPKNDLPKITNPDVIRENIQKAIAVITSPKAGILKSNFVNIKGNCEVTDDVVLGVYDFLDSYRSYGWFKEVDVSGKRWSVGIQLGDGDNDHIISVYALSKADLESIKSNPNYLKGAAIRPIGIAKGSIKLKLN